MLLSQHMGSPVYHLACHQNHAKRCSLFFSFLLQSKRSAGQLVLNDSCADGSAVSAVIGKIVASSTTCTAQKGAKEQEESIAV